MEPSLKIAPDKPPRFSWVVALVIGSPYGIVMSTAYAYGFLGLTVSPFNLLDFTIYVVTSGAAMELASYIGKKRAWNRARQN